MLRTATLIATASCASAIRIRSHNKSEDWVDTAVDVGEFAYEHRDEIANAVSSVFGGWV